MTDEEKQQDLASTDGMKPPPSTGDNLTDDQRHHAKKGTPAPVSRPVFPTDPGLPKKETVEQEIQRKGLNAPRVTDADVEANVADELYHVFPDTTVTVCCLRLKNNFTVIGHSACASKQNFDVKLGQRIARDDAKRQIWGLMGYELRTTLRGLTPFGTLVDTP